jgi:hypothetical protein
VKYATYPHIATVTASHVGSRYFSVLIRRNLITLITTTLYNISLRSTYIVDRLKHYNPPTIKTATTPIFRFVCIRTFHIMTIGRNRIRMSVVEFMAATNVHIFDTSMHDP